MRSLTLCLPVVLLALLALASSADAGDFTPIPVATSAMATEALSMACTASSGPCSTFGVEREALGGGLAWYRFDLRVGAGDHDVIRLHRITREHLPWWPVSAPTAILLAHGDRWGFEATYLSSRLTDTVPDEQSLAVFLASHGVDVWGIDFRWSLVPVDEPDLSFMADWGLATDAGDLAIGLGIARWTRLLTGSGFGRIHLAGFSRGGQAGYVHLAAETQRPARHRHTAGFVALDIGLTSDDPEVVARSCARYAQTADDIAAGSTVASTTIFELVADLALTAPDDPSPLFDPFTNRQLAIDLGAFGRPDGIVPFFHGVAGTYDESGFFPVGLTYTREEHFFAHTRAQAYHQPRRIFLEAEEILCDQTDSPLDDHLGEVSVPVLYIGAGGGFGSFGLDTTTRLASTDITSVIVSFEPPENRTADFGHVDLFLADDAETLVWQPILDWLID